MRICRMIHNVLVYIDLTMIHVLHHIVRCTMPFVYRHNFACARYILLFTHMFLLMWGGYMVVFLHDYIGYIFIIVSTIILCGFSYRLWKFIWHFSYTPRRLHPYERYTNAMTLAIVRDELEDVVMYYLYIRVSFFVASVVLYGIGCCMYSYTSHISVYMHHVLWVSTAFGAFALFLYLHFVRVKTRDYDRV